MLTMRPAAADRPVPQADRLHVVAAVVDAVDAGCIEATTIAEAIGMVARQGAYYPHAAADLGYLERRDGNWELTDDGVAFSAMGAEARVDDLCARLAGLSYLATFTAPGGPETLAGEWAEGGLGDETISRRLQTIEAWTQFLVETDRDTQVAMISKAADATRRAAPDAKAAAQARRQARAEKRAAAAAERAVATGSNLVGVSVSPRRTRFCATCGVALPSGSDECDMCY